MHQKGFVENKRSFENGVKRIQASWRGQKSRKNLSVKSLASGLISVRMCGDRKFFEKMGFQGAFSEIDPEKNTPHQLAYLAVDRKRFMGCVLAHEDRLLNPMQLNFSEVGMLTGEIGKTIACINGGFFNYHHFASTEIVEHASIGKSVSHGKEMSSLPFPDEYKDDYSPIEFEDQSMLEIAPRLSSHGEPTFTEDKMRNQKYSVEKGFSLDKDYIIPGHLRHAAERHPRAAISTSTNLTHGWTRLIAGIAPGRRPDAQAGYTLTEWAQITARIDKLSFPTNSSLNLDGGGSVAIVVMRPNGSRMDVAQSEDGRAVANLIGFIKR